MMNLMNWAVIVIGLTITLTGCQKLILPTKTKCIGNPILKPVFLDGNLDGATYLTVLQDLRPPLAASFPDPLDPNIPDKRIWYQQDRAPPHYAVIVSRYLDEVFANRWIGRRGQIK
jgi:hypothetical protein